MKEESHVLSAVGVSNLTMPGAIQRVTLSRSPQFEGHEFEKSVLIQRDRFSLE